MVLRTRFLQVAALAAMAAGAHSTGSAAPPVAAASPAPLGWSSWNSFANTIDSAITRAQTDALVTTGLKAAGYQYVNIDEGWWLGERDAAGGIVVDAKQWPAIAPGERAGDMANIVRYIHAKGLKAGIYTDVGRDGCSMYPDVGPAYGNVGSRGHYVQDFTQFAKWGFDYVKVDWCGGDKENLSGAVAYAEVARAIDEAARATGRRLYLSICNWGKQSPWSWAPGVGGVGAAVWRTGADIVPPIVVGGPHEDRRITTANILKSFDDSIHPEAQHTGFFNDADMMVVGMPGTGAAMDRLHMGLWAMGGGPLLLGADLTRLTPAAIATLTNKDVLAIDQDAVGLQAVKVAEPEAGLEVWVKRLAAPGARAVLLLNRTHYPAPMRIEAGMLGLVGATVARDVWAGGTVVPGPGGLAAEVPAADARLMIVRGEDAAGAFYPWEAGPGPRSARVKAGTGSVAAVRIDYINTGPDAAARLFLDGEAGTTLNLPHAAKARAVWVQARIARDGGVLAIEPGAYPGVRVQGLTVY